MDSVIQTIAVYAIPLIFAITLHEAAHGYVARMFGDNTAEQAGRISLNPIRHIDPIGTLLVPALILLTSKLFGGGLLFGWAKPVPVNFGRLRNPKRDMLWVAAAGPASNLVMAIGWAIAIKIMIASGVTERFFLTMGIAGVQVNLTLMALNLLPIPPLDGGRILFSLLPTRLAMQFARIEPYGMVILLVLLATGVLSTLLSPLLAIGDLVIRLFL
ncbi:site-2 protease family protein [Pigmentiphaga aceris]|uniref:Site-2 protease family protein n=1 Tax=Pigmentiphaga aceris TaxID=1940612 RepID=A0A5C0ATB4_9BURK|nr:site-2 protease family protein [Pigmentiphaga aceris]QEI05589.1 site-2 protease family protein [Pigmentiphaga aceris]